MATRPQKRQMAIVMSTAQSAGKLLFFLGIFLLLLEGVSFFGSSSHSSKVVDVIAVLLTCLLLVLSLFGVRILSFLFNRFFKESKESNAL